MILLGYMVPGLRRFVCECRKTFSFAGMHEDEAGVVEYLLCGLWVVSVEVGGRRGWCPLRRWLCEERGIDTASEPQLRSLLDDGFGQRVDGGEDPVHGIECVFGEIGVGKGVGGP